MGNGMVCEGAYSAGDFHLRPHQKEAVNAIVRGLSGAQNNDDVRGTVVMATGTGKTVTAAAAARRVVPRGRCGVLVPTLDLLAQTAEAWRRAGHRGRMVAVCSLGDDPLLEALGVRCTTDPAQLARWAGEGGPVVVLMTYACLVAQEARQDGEDGPWGSSRARRGVLEKAMHGAGFTGPCMPGFDLLVVDEAHRTSGDLGKAWAAALDSQRVPAVRRLFMTATPRLWEAPPDGGGGRARLVASMDDESLYGPVLFELELMEAVERGLLARWEVDVLEITDPHPPEPDADDEEVQGRRLAALQAALLTRLDEVGGRSLLTFHSTTLAAMAMARSLPQTAAQLHATDPARYPAQVGAEWLCGEHSPAHRRQVLGRFADGLTADGWVADAQILASCQVLAEGVDIRGRAGVDGVVLADARSSPVQIVQILGRALRQEPGEGKTARIVVPVFLAPGERPEEMMTSSSYRPLLQVLAGLQAHDERIVQRLMLAASSSSGTPTNTLTLDPATPQPTQATTAGQEDGAGGNSHGSSGETDNGGAAAGGREHHSNQDQDGTEGGSQERDEHGGAADDETGADDRFAGVPLLRFTHQRDPALIAKFLRTRILQPDSKVWLAGYEALQQWVDEHGHARVPATATLTRPDGTPYPLGSWIQEQRRAFQNGTLRPHRYELLDELGMVWDVADAKFTNGLTAARAYCKKFGTLCAPRDAMVDGFALGQWLENLRKGAMALTESRDAVLREIDQWWNPPWPISWQRHWSALAYLLHDETGPVQVPPGVRACGLDVGTWLRRQLATWPHLEDGQRKLLQKLGVQAPAETDQTQPDAAAPAVTDLHDLNNFERGVAAARQYLAREGHLTVPRHHQETLHPATPDGTPAKDGAPVTVRLGVWLTNQKTRRAKLTPQRRQALADLGLQWAK
ncbi:Helicase associated domain protein [Streptomyces sp. TRM 70361]|uniref:DEAD/DEAH box helicase n=1 Tax=Streptomyces sp. TRM 70361 TaxID=3116553 RepID=UPI002E7B7F20|nr:Helicase associated domain protein [Streptomyces sp. TRM 70361]MEE1943045.1 Helicase associated domain protein [Streptomyces sp. TRM 70361]